MSPRRRSSLVLAVLLLLGRASAALAQGCAMCGTAFGAKDPQSIAFFWSILFMMVTPYTLVAAVAIWLYRNRRRETPDFVPPAEAKETLT